MNRVLPIAFTFAVVSASAFAADSARYTVIFGGQKVGHVIADTTANRTTIDYNVKNNGRGPTMAETITFGPDGLPTAWTVSGTTTFGSKVNETSSATDHAPLGSTRLARARRRRRSPRSMSPRVVVLGRCRSTPAPCSNNPA
jgi:hypothetical protein